MPIKKTPLEIQNNINCDIDKKAIGVRGRTNDGVCERLATELTLGQSKTSLSSIYTILQSMYGKFMEKVLNRNNSNNAGIFSLGSGYDEGSDYIATKKLQTQNIQQIDVRTGAYTYNINQVSDPGKFKSAEINQIVISGFNFSQDARLKIKYYAFRASDDVYYMIWQNSIGYGNSQGLQYESKITFNPIPVGDWNGGDGRYGYIEVGVDSGGDNHDFNVLVSVNPFVNHNT